MPGGIRLFLVYAFLILAGIGLSLRSVVDLAISTPVSFEGLIVMVLLAYTIFTTTLVLQRKQAARNLALGLASLTIPLVPLLRPQPADRRGDLRRVARAAPVPRAAPTRGPDLPERAVSARLPARTARGTVPSRCLAARPTSPPISRHHREQTQPSAPGRQSAIDRPSRAAAAFEAGLDRRRLDRRR